jgi:hypothetical protein
VPNPSDTDRDCPLPLRDIVVAAREEALVGIVGVGSGVVRGDIAIVMLGIFHEAVTVEPVVEDQHVVAGRQENVSASDLVSADLVTDLLRGMRQLTRERVGSKQGTDLQVSGPVSATCSACAPSHRHHARAILAVPIWREEGEGE